MSAAGLPVAGWRLGGMCVAMAVAAGLAGGLCLRASPPSARVLTWDSQDKSYRAQAGEQSATLAFVATNSGARAVVIERIEPACGCTVATPPKSPWRLAPGESGTLTVKVDLAGKWGELTKTIAIGSDAGAQALTVRVTIPEAAAFDPRAGNCDRATTAADRQAVFREDCARCHAAPAVGRKGAQLFQVACAICHESVHRATMVPSLEHSPATRDAVYWHTVIAGGRPNTLMPAFAIAREGPLTEAQIQSLVAYLLQRYPVRP